MLLKLIFHQVKAALPEPTLMQTPQHPAWRLGSGKGPEKEALASTAVDWTTSDAADNIHCHLNS